jgi:hypothetical protein
MTVTGIGSMAGTGIGSMAGTGIGSMTGTGADTSTFFLEAVFLDCFGTVTGSGTGNGSGIGCIRDSAFFLEGLPFFLASIFTIVYPLISSLVLFKGPR